MANVFLKKLGSSSSDSIVLASTADVFGDVNGQEELFVIQNGSSFPTGIVVEQTIEKVTLTGALSDFTFAKSGTTDVLVYRGSTLVATIRPQTDDDVGANGTALAFTSGSVLSTTLNVISASEIRIGGGAGQVLTGSAAAFDTTAPTITIASNDSALKIGDVAHLSFTLSEAATNFAAADITVTGGTLTNFAGSGTSYTADFTPSASSTTPATVDVAAAKFTDAAGNANTAATQLTMSVDTLAPVFAGAAVNASTLVLTYTEASTLDASHAPAAGAFAVLVGGVANAVTAVAVDATAKTVTLTLITAVTDGAVVTVDYTAPAVDNTTGNAAIQDAAGNDAASLTAHAVTNNNTSFSINGTIADGYLRGATVFADTNGNGVWDAGEATATTDANGDFNLTGAHGKIIASGGTDIATNLPFHGVLTAPAGSAMVTPLTTLVQSMVDSGATVEQAQTQVLSALGLPATVNLQTFDAMAVALGTGNAADKADAAHVQAALAQVANILDLGTAAIQGASSTTTAADAMAQMATALANNFSAATATVDLTQTATLQSVMTEAATANSTDTGTAVTASLNDIASVISSANTSVNTAMTANPTDITAAMTQVAQVQVVVQGSMSDSMTTGMAAGSITSTVTDFTGTALDTAVTTAKPGDLTQDTTPPALTGAVSVASSNSTNTLAKVGDTITLSFTTDGSQSGAPTATIDGHAATVAHGTGNAYTATYAMADTDSTGAVSFAINAVDAAGNAMTAVTAVTDSSAVTFDKTAPTITIGTDDSDLKIGDVAHLTFTLSETATNFTATDVLVTGGVLSNFAGSGASYTADFTPSASSTTAATVDVAGSTFTDAAGNNNTTATQVSMSVETTAPQISPMDSRSPSNNGSLQASNDLVLVYTEEVRAGTGNVNLYEANGTLIESFDVVAGSGSAGGSLAIAGTHLRLNPNAALTASTGYYLHIDATAIKDTAGNAYAGISDATTLHFTATADAAPTLISSFDGSRLPSNSSFNCLYFSEFVKADTGNIVLVDDTAHSSTNIAVTDTIQIIFNTSYGKITVNPTDDLIAGHAYHLTIDSTAITDEGGVAYAGIADTTTVNFTVTGAPTFNAVATDDIINAAERTDTVTVTGANDDGSTVTLDGHAASVTGTTWSYNLDATAINALGQGVHTLTAVATDVTVHTTLTSSTRDISVDTVAPIVSAVTDATGAVTNAPITFTVTFDEAVVGTVDTTSFTATNASITSVAQVGVTNVYTVVATPTASVASGNVALSLVAGSLTDAAGNPLVNADLSGKDSQAIDTLAPAAAVVVTYSGNNDTTVNAAEAATGLTISGTNELGATVTLAGQTAVAETTTAWHVVLDTATIASYGQGPEALTVMSTDAAGNATNTPVNLSVDTVAPALTDAVSVTSSNTAHTLAKVGDTITLSFTTDGTQAGLPTASIDGLAVTVTAGSGNAYTANYAMASGDSTGAVTFAINAVDAAGNAMTAVTAVTDSSAVTFASGTVRFVDKVGGTPDHYATIQAAIDATTTVTGDTILVAAGIYAEALTINKGVTIVGANAGIDGAGARGAETVITGQSKITATDKVVVDGVKFLDNHDYTLSSTDKFVALEVAAGSTAGYVIENSVFLRDGTDPTGFNPTTWAGSGSQPTHWGLEIDAGAVPSGASITVENNLFTGANSYAYAGDNWSSAVFSNGGVSTTTLQHNTFTNVRTGINADSFSPTVAISHNSFSQDGTAISVGLGSNVAPVTSITDNTFAQVDTGFNFKNLTTPVSFDAIATHNTTTNGAMEIDGGSAGDTFTSGSGNDVIIGNGGIDTAVYATSLSSSSFSYDTANHAWAVNRGAGGTDYLIGVEKVSDGSTGHHFLLVGNGGYTTIQAAITAAWAGDTILVAAGNYIENVTIDKSITLLSVGGRGTTMITGVESGAEVGAVVISSGVNNVRIGDAGQGFTIIGINGNGAIEKASVYITGNHDMIAIAGNCITANGDVGLQTEYGAAVTHLSIDANIFDGKTFTGSAPSGTGFGTQFDVGNNTPRQLVVIGNGGGGVTPANYLTNNVSFTNNDVTGTAGGVNTGGEQGNTLVTIDADQSTISGNNFTGFTNRFGEALRARGPNTTVTNNTIDHRPHSSETTGFTINNKGYPATYSGNIIDGGPASESLTGTPGNDQISGGAGDNVITGGAGADTLTGGGGNDVFVYDTVSDWSASEHITDFGITALNTTVLANAAIAGLNGDVLRFDLSNLAATAGYSALTALTTGAPANTNGSTLVAADFVSGAGATANAAHAQFIQDTTSGILYFDPDGTGVTAVMAIAIVGTAAMTGAEILLVA